MIYKIPTYMLTKEKEETWLTENEGDGILALDEDGRKVCVPVDPSTNTLITGVTGTGKTSSFTVQAAKLMLKTHKDMKAVFFEIKDTFLKECFERGDKIISYDGAGIDKNALFRWNLIKEIRQAENKEAEMKKIADFLFRELLDGAAQNRAWVETARNLFVAVMRTMVYGCQKNTSNYSLINSLRTKSIGEILKLISAHPRNQSILKEFNYDGKKKPEDYVPSRRAEDVFFFLSKILEKFGGAFEASDGEDTMHDFLHNPKQKMFILYDLKTSESSRDFILYFLKKIKDEKMSNTSNLKHIPLLLCLDEVDKLSEGSLTADFGLFQIVELGREYNIVVLLATQSIENLYALSEKYNTHRADGSLAGFQVLLSFRTGDRKTLETLQVLYGSEYKKHIILPVSRYDKPHIQSEYRPIVSELEFTSLKIGEAYIKFKHYRPKKVRFLLDRKGVV